jgi:magnesium transporter
MPADSQRVARALVRRFVERFPDEAAARCEALSPNEIVEVLGVLDDAQAVTVVGRLRHDVAAEVVELLPEAAFRRIVPALEPAQAAPMLARLDRETRERRLALLDAPVAKELSDLMTYPPDTAGGLMDPRATTFRAEATVRQAEARLRRLGRKWIQQVFVVDDDGRLVGTVPLQDLVLAPPRERLEPLMQRNPPAVSATSPQSEVVEVLEQHHLPSVAVIDFEGRLVGVIRQEGLIAAAEAEATADLLTMVGAGKEERALSGPALAIRKRLPWLQINLVTAFLAASVVGLFESTIAQFTALAVLLPVVAGQSGNTGAQALAVTMRGLALREIRVRQWFRIAGKELLVGAVNGVAVALVTSVAVYLWSGSGGLALVIGTAMVASMVIAGLAGASIPMILTTLGQDPAAAASIILTTVTDVIGFLSFLGLATLAAGLL